MKYFQVNAKVFQQEVLNTTIQHWYSGQVLRSWDSSEIQEVYT